MYALQAENLYIRQSRCNGEHRAIFQALTEEESPREN